MISKVENHKQFAAAIHPGVTVELLGTGFRFTALNSDCLSDRRVREVADKLRRLKFSVDIKPKK